MIAYIAVLAGRRRHFLSTLNAREPQSDQQNARRICGGRSAVKAIHIRYNGRQVYQPREARAGRPGRSEHKKCENELAAGGRKGGRETGATLNCQNEPPARSTSPPFAAHGTSLRAEDAHGEKLLGLSSAAPPTSAAGVLVVVQCHHQVSASQEVWNVCCCYSGPDLSGGRNR